MMHLRQVPADRPPGTRPPTLPAGQISINEIYESIQGECGWIGTPTVFVRTSHCPLRCVWCDSQYTFHEGTPWPTRDVIARVAEFPTRHVCLTGGEPLSQPESFMLCETLARRGYTIEVETSGYEDIAPFNRCPPAERRAITINLDVKCPGSAMTNFNRWSNLAELRGHDQLKFVIADRGDYDYAKQVLAKHPVPCSAWIQPVWKALDAAQIAGWVQADGLAVRVGIQLHKYLWGERRGV